MCGYESSWSATPLQFVVCTQCHEGLNLMRNRTFSTNYPTRYSFCVPDCKQAHQSQMWTQNGTCDSNLTNCVTLYLDGGEYCASSNWQHGCELSASPAGSPVVWTVSSTAGNLKIPSHYSTIFRESFYSGACTSTTVSGACNECGAGLGGTPTNTACAACSDDMYYPGISKCQLASAAVGAIQTNNACRDGYIDSTGKCVTNCGVGQYGAITASSGGAVLKSTCAACTAANCYECIGATQCTSCKPGFYLQRNTATNTWGNMNTYGTCFAKSGSNTGLKVYVQSEACFSGGSWDTTYFTNLKTPSSSINIGTTQNNPFPFLSEAITKAYEVGAPFISATVTILLMDCSGESGKNIHYMRRMTSSESRYIPTAFDNQQTTTIIIQPFSTSNGYATQIVYYKLKDRFTFPVGAGLTVKNIVFDGLDSLAYYDYATSAIYNSMVISENTCSLTSSTVFTLKDCKGKQPAAFWTPTDNCLMTSGMGSGLFTFDLSSQSKMIVIPTLKLDGVTIQNFNYNFNSLIELNSHGGKVEIKNSLIQQINSCGAIIRNSQNFLTPAFTASATPAYTEFYTERSSRFLYETYNTKYASFADHFVCPATGCFAITITGSTFTNFGTMKAVLTTPVTVNPLGGLQYTGHVLDLNNFDGPVSISGSTFSQIGLKYSSCSVIVPLLNVSPPAGTDPYPSFGLKTKYQIKSLISIIGQDQPVDILGNSFTDNSGTKGIIYIDINHSLTSRRLTLGGNTFLKNSGYLGSDVIYVRSRGPVQATSLYLDIPLQGAVYCSGFLFQGNSFTSNYGCQQSAGGVIKFECLDSTEVSTLANDVITLAPLDSATAASYQGITFTGYTVVPEAVTYGSATYNVDRQMTTFNLNTYTSNTASGGMGLVDISGAPRITITSEVYTNNGDSQSQLTAKLTNTGFVDNPVTTDSLSGAFTSAIAYAPSTLMLSLINVQRTSQVIISSMSFTSNWMIENTQCDFTRAQLFTFSQLYGQLSITGLTVLDHLGPSSNTYLKNSPISITLSGLSATQQLGSRVPFFRFANSVFLTQATFTQWSFKNINFYEDSACTTALGSTNMFFSFPGDPLSAHVELLTFNQAIASVATFKTVNCFLCTQPTMIIGQALTVLIQNINFQTINQQNSNPSQNSLILFKLQKPFTIGGGSLRTPIITLNTVVVNTYSSKQAVPSQGRLFDMSYVIPSAGSTEVEPISAQVVVQSCTFTSVNTAASGTFAQVDLNSIQMLISSTTFTSFSGDASFSFGGVINAISLGALTLTSVTAKYFKAKDVPFVSPAPSTAGGGGFLYINQNAPFSLTINGASQFNCQVSNNPLVFQYTLFAVQSLQYSVGSAFQLISNSFPFTVNVVGSSFRDCFGANQGAVFSMSSSLSVINFNLQGNTFFGNSALNGGSIYCFNCYMSFNIWLNNQFSYGFANNGGDVYLHNLLGQTSFTLDTQIHLNSKAQTSGGAFFYLEDVGDIVMIYLTTVTGGLPNVNTAEATTGSGGAFNLQATLGSISFSATSTVFTSCTSKLQGGLFNMLALNDISLSLTNSNIQDASSGVGGIAYISGSSSTITIQQTALPTGTTANLQSTQATTGDGGLFYSTIPLLYVLLPLPVVCQFTLTTTMISSSKAQIGRGGLYFCAGDGAALLSITGSVIKDSGGKQGGGVFYLSMTSDVTLTITDTLISGSTASSSAGGFAFLETTLGNVLVNLIGLSAITQIDYSTALTDGGMMYLNGALSNTISLMGLLSFTSSISTLGEGGFAKMTGTSNTFTLSTKTTIDKCISGMNGGCFMMAGTQINNAKFEGDTINFPSITALKVTGTDPTKTYNGGLIYLRGLAQTVSIKNIILQSSTVKGNGGVIYSEVANVGVPLININIAGIGSGIQQLSGMTAVGSPASHGSFLYVSANNAPILALLITNTVIKCMSGDFCATNQTYGPIYSVLNQTIIPPSTLIGGLFYFEPGVQGTISTNGCIFAQCYTTTEGSVFYLNGGLSLDDQNSNFTGNAGLMGQIFCNKCIATLTGSKFQCMISQQGSLIWIDSGTTSSSDQVSVTFKSASISNGRSIGNGGAVYAQGNQPGSISFITCAVMTLFETPLSGGFFYIGNPMLVLGDKTGSNWNHIWVGQNGSLVEGGGVTPDSTFSIPCKLGNITGGDAVYPCSFVSGGLDVVGCQISCGAGIIALADQATQIQLTSGKYSLYSFKSKTILTKSNTINNCLAVNGAVYNLIDSNLTDINSTFSYNGAQKGGVAYCSNCNMKFINSTFIGNFATQGGTFFIQDRGILTLENVIIQGSSAQAQGGLIYGAGYQEDMTIPPSSTPISSTGDTAPIIFPYVMINITQTPVGGVYLSFGQFNSLGDGGGIYIKNGTVLINSMNIDGSSAVGNGGFVYTVDQVQVSIVDSVFTNLVAMNGGFVYAVNSTAVPQLLPSTISFFGSNSFTHMSAAQSGGGFYLSNPGLSITLNTAITIEDSTAVKGDGGVFYINQLNFIDFRQSNPLLIANYNTVSASKGQRGSFLYSSAIGVSIYLENINLNCRNATPVGGIQAQLVVPVIIQYAGAIYVQDALFINSAKNTFQNCYGADIGGIFTINTIQGMISTPFQELGSTYINNHAQSGGVINCQSCNMNIIGTPLSIVSFTQSASELGGVIYIASTTVSTITGVTFSNNIAKQGGVIAAVNTTANSYLQQGYLYISNCIFQTQSAQEDGGGAFYLNTNQLSYLNISSSSVISSTSGGNGGIFYVNKMNGTIMLFNDILTDFSVAFTVKQPNSGSLYYSSNAFDVNLVIMNSFITCNSSYNFVDAVASLNAKLSYVAGAIYLEQSTHGLSSSDNQYKKCHLAQDGGAFHIVSSNIIEQRSVFSSMSSLYGGVFKCSSCTFNFTGSNLDYSQAVSGGALMMEDNADGTFTSTSFSGTQATETGGLFSITQGGKPLQSTTVYFLNCPNMINNLAKQGGVFYIDQPLITIHLTNVNIQGSYASQQGGVVQMQSGTGFILQGSVVINVLSPSSSVFYSTSNSLNLKILASQITCNSLYSTLDANATLNNPIATAPAVTNGFYISGNQQTFVNTESSTFKKCGIFKDGGLFKIQGNVNFKDTSSIFTDNSAIEGGVISCSQCNINLLNTKFQYNQAKRGGVIKLESSGNLISTNAIFINNYAVETGGVIYVMTQSVFNLRGTLFDSNIAATSSTIDVLGASSTLINNITGCTFQYNSAVKNTISLNTALAIISGSFFKNNYSQQRSKNIFIAFAKVNMTDCQFFSDLSNNTQAQLTNEQTMGAFINIILDVTIYIQNSIFTNGLASYGGAIYISGQSHITIDNCILNNNLANVNGGAIFASGFASISVIGGTTLSNNIANSAGDDFFLTNTDNIFALEDVQIDNPNAKNSIYAETVTVQMNRVRIHNICNNPLSLKGAALYCYGCRGIKIIGSTFNNLVSHAGAAIYITDFPTNKRTQDKSNKYFIQNTIFLNTTAYTGGAIYLDHPQMIEIQSSTFTSNAALNTTKASSPLIDGVGGAIYYKCSAIDNQCSLKITGPTNFNNNFAQIKGGAIHWDYNQPSIGPNVKFRNNKAAWYGDDLSSYSQQLMAVSLLDYNNQFSKINYPLTLEQFQAGKTSGMQRQLQTSKVLNNSQQSQLIAQNDRSGSVIPDFQLAHVDMYGQIVNDFDSKIRVSVDSSFNKIDANTKTYTAVLEGTTQFTSYGGVAQASGLQFTGAPGYNYRLQFLTNGIDETLPQNQMFMKSTNLTAIQFNFVIELRNCSLGEYFSQAGKCIYCDSTMGYSLLAMTKPGTCTPCPIDSAQCLGGPNIGPLPGYWRRTNTSSNFIKCPNKDACLGWVAPDWNPKGACSEGQYGILCAQCMPGYSLTGLAKCGKCPELVSNVVKLVGLVILITIVFVLMVKSSIAGATQAKNNTSIYIKILMNHFQLVLLVSSFNFQWPPQLLTFFAATSPVSSASTQVVSIDCFMAAKTTLSTAGESFFDTYFLKLGIFALMPIMLGVISYIFWWVQKCINSALGFQGGKAMATVVVSLFTVHPNIVQTMFDDFNCVNIDGDQRIYTAMTIQCYHAAHSFWSFAVAMPSIIVWGLGIPFFAYVMMFRARKELDTVATKEKFGFLYAGYQQQYFYWEIVIMYRKIAMIFISVFIQPYGVICQALIVFLLMLIFLVATLKKKPYLAVALNDLEMISLLTSSLSIYCGFFFISSIPEADMASLPAVVKGGIALSDNMKLILFMIILISNVCFFGYWAFKMFQEMKATFIKKAEKIYLLLCLCGNRVKLSQLKHKMKLDEENELLREKYFASINHLKNVYKEGKLVLTHQTLERAVVYLNEDRYFEALGLGKRDITQQDQRRYNRVAQGAEIKQNEKNKGEFTEEFRKNMDMRRKNDGSGPIDPREHLAIDDEYLEGMKGSKGGRILKIMPEKFQNNSESGYGNDDSRRYSSRQTTHQLTTEQKMLDTSSLYDEEVAQVTSAVQVVANKKGKLEGGLNPAKVIKNGKKPTSPQQQKNRVQGSFDSSIQSDAKDGQSQMWEDSENEINMGSTTIPKDPSKPKKKGKDPNAGLEDDLNINVMLQKGDIQLQSQKVSNYRGDNIKSITQSKGKQMQGQLRKKPTDKAQDKTTVKPAPIVKQEEKKAPQLKIDDDLDFYMGNKSVDDEQDVKKQKKNKKKQDSDDDNSDVFSDSPDEHQPAENKFSGALNKRR